ncbi:hypothetical protein SAMN05421630_106430 [Prauserella marina]|uniref:Uncharacterized protein n=1 Tax=Prauserella marina TaxID=530584 RepID=A0A1G6SWS9_9PSEU|nr:hypothetical protein DES30_102430 [Prauserella marina]SDD21312.1 hypothetical protein SAMN05421630_106430 [Prauserella marina]
MLVAAGWVVIRIWEHEPLDTAFKRVTTAIEHGFEGS